MALAFAFIPASRAQDVKTIIQTAVQAELNADKTDNTPFQYYDHDVTPDHNTLVYVVETPVGNLKKQLADHDRPLSPEQRQQDDRRIESLVHDPAAQARLRGASSHDDDESARMLRLFPVAFVWTVTGETPSAWTLDFKPDPNYSPSGFEAKVLSAMGGQITVSRPGNRIASIKGTLLDDVTFGFGILGRLRKGGSFNVVRREVAPGHWQIVTSNVHINGHALFFKTIGSDEDEARTDFKLSPAKNLQQAADILKSIH